MKKNTTDTVLTEEQKKLIIQWADLNKLCEKYAYDSSGDGPHEWAVRNLQSTEKALAKLGIKYTDIPKMQKMIKKEKMKKAIKNIILAPFNAAKHITGKAEPQR